MNSLLAPRFTLVSDLDDTLKISHTSHRLKTVVRGLLFSHAYAGMSELYQEWLSRGEPFYLVSSSPKAILGRVTRFLKKNHFPQATIQLRDWIQQPDIRAYKSETLRKIVQNSNGPIIFVGDDSEWDPEVFTRIQKDHPEKVLAIYIRKMRGRPLPEGAIGFHTAFEIAYHELLAGRMNIPQASRVGKAILDQKNSDLVIPYFAVSPQGLPLPEYMPIQNLMNRVHDRLIDIHAARKKP